MNLDDMKAYYLQGFQRKLFSIVFPHMDLFCKKPGRYKGGLGYFMVVRLV